VPRIQIHNIDGARGRELLVMGIMREEEGDGGIESKE
jgi:hypothetical protein